MIVAAANLTGWWIGYGIGAAIVVVVAALLLAITATARRIASVAEDGTSSLRRTQERTEVLWQVGATNQVAADLLAGATEARRALGGGEPDSAGADGGGAPQTPNRKGLGGPASSQPAGLPTEPHDGSEA